jgi:hypothetical protein
VNDRKRFLLFLAVFLLTFVALALAWALLNPAERAVVEETAAFLGDA